jgi:DNA-binding NtrC family response regulator
MAKVIDQFQAVIAGLRRSAGRRPSVSAVAEAPWALAVMSDGPDRDALKAIFRDAGWKLAVAGDFASAIAGEERDHSPIILYERELGEKDWRPAVSIFSRLSPRPCVILLSRNSDKNLWDELVRCGGFDLLRTPLNGNAAVRTLKAAWAIWQNQHTPRQAFAKSRC